MIVAYRKNNVKYIVRSKVQFDQIVQIDSICINKSGYITSQTTLKGSANEMKFVYDSINRIIESESRTDVYTRYKDINYTFEKSKRIVYQDFNNNETLKIYRFDPSLKMIIESFQIYGTDTVSKTEYKYYKGKIRSILLNDLEENRVADFIAYFYDNNENIRFIQDNLEKQYISPNTGLIDSAFVPDPDVRINYKYYKY